MNPLRRSLCGKCGTAVTSGLLLCERCALRWTGTGPSWLLNLAPQKRPPYEQQPTTPQGDDDATSA